MANNPTEDYTGILKDLAHTMMSVSRESVNLIKRSDQQHALKLQRKQEWDIYLEFLRMLFNLVDRLSAFYIPIQAQRDFMNSLEDSVAHQLKTVLAPSLSSTEIDDMEGLPKKPVHLVSRKLPLRHFCVGPPLCQLLKVFSTMRRSQKTNLLRPQRLLQMIRLKPKLVHRRLRQDLPLLFLLRRGRPARV